VCVCVCVCVCVSVCALFPLHNSVVVVCHPSASTNENAHALVRDVFFSA